MTPQEFSDICHQYLDLYGSRLTHAATPCLATVRTPVGNHYIKYTSTFFAVSTAGYEGLRHIYFRLRGGERENCWLPDEAEKLLPYIKKRLVLELLAGCMKKWSTEQNNPTVLEIIDLSGRILKLSGKLDLRAANLVYKTTTVLTIGKTHIRGYPSGRLEIRRMEDAADKRGIQCWSLVLCADEGTPWNYDTECIDRLVIQLRRVLILESLANI